MNAGAKGIAFNSAILPQKLNGYSTLEDETKLWLAGVLARGGVTSLSLSVANNLVQQIKAATYANKLRYLLPLLGTNLNSALVPIWDVARLGLSTINSAGTPLTDAAFSEATGITGTGAGNIILPFTFGQIASVNGGVGYWAKAVDQSGTNSIVVGTHENSGSDRFGVDLRNTTTNEIFFWGSSANSVGTATTAGNHHYYGQRSSATSRAIYRDGAIVGSPNTTSDPATNYNNRAPRLMGAISASAGEFYAKGQCYCAYFTDGSLNSTEIADLHTLLNTWLISPLGR